MSIHFMNYKCISNIFLQVVWRRTSQPHPISVGLDIYVPDDRYHVQHIPYRGSWNLMIKNVNLNDAGVYECQISAKERAGSRRLVLLNVLGRFLLSLLFLRWSCRWISFWNIDGLLDCAIHVMYVSNASFWRFRHNYVKSIFATHDLREPTNISNKTSTEMR
jgi:hypothetical protein